MLTGLQQRLDDAERALDSTRAALDARIDVAVRAIAAVVVPRADASVLRAAAALLDDEQLAPERLLVFIEPRRAALARELADVDADANDVEARRLVDDARAATDTTAAVLLRSRAARLERLAARRRAAEVGLQTLDAEVIAWAQRAVVAQLRAWLGSGPTLGRFEMVATAISTVAPTAKVAKSPAARTSVAAVLRAARALSAGRRYLDAVVERRLTPLVRALNARALQRELDAQAGVASDDDVAFGAEVDAGLAVCGAVARAVDGFHDFDSIADDDVLWDRLLGDGAVQALLGDDAAGSFVDEVNAARARAAFTGVPTRLDIEPTEALSPSSSPPRGVGRAVALGEATRDAGSDVGSDEGERIGRYRLLRPLGSGGMAEVWLAEQDGPRGFRKEVVVKRILADHAGDPHFIALFQREASVISQLRHPNIVDVFDLGVEGDRWFMVMERLRGKSLLDVAREFQGRAFPVDVAASAGADAARGLGCAHDKPVVHRDISPDNLFVTDTGLTKVIDFGVAWRKTDRHNPNALVGKVPFIAPEVFRGEAFDGAVDVFALGVTLWFLLVGRRPFQGANPGMVMRAILETQAPPPSSERTGIPGPVDELIAAMLAPGAKDRPTAREVDAALSSWAAPPSTMMATARM